MTTVTEEAMSTKVLKVPTGMLTMPCGQRSELTRSRM